MSAKERLGLSVEDIIRALSPERLEHLARFFNADGSVAELVATRKRLEELEQLYAETQADATQSDYSRELTLRSLRRTINQMKEEIARFLAHTGSMVVAPPKEDRL